MPGAPVFFFPPPQKLPVVMARTRWQSAPGRLLYMLWAAGVDDENPDGSWRVLKSIWALPLESSDDESRNSRVIRSG